MRNAIDRALGSVAHLFQSDYEGDETYIALVDDEQRFEKLITPYVEEYIQEDDAVDPIDIIKGYDAEKGIHLHSMLYPFVSIRLTIRRCENCPQFSVMESPVSSLFY